MQHINCASLTLNIWCADHWESGFKHRSRARLSHSPPHTPSWAESFLTILHTLSWLTLSTDQRLTAPAPSLGLDGAASIQQPLTCAIFHPCSLNAPPKKRESSAGRWGRSQLRVTVWAAGARAKVGWIDAAARTCQWRQMDAAKMKQVRH